MNEIVTFFSTHKSEVVRPVKLAQVLTAFKNGQFASKIAGVRRVLESEGEEAYKAAKRGLPAIAFCGEFAGGHAKDNLVKYNNLLVFDIDHLTEEGMRQSYERLASDEYILAFWVSPSGNGYKGLIRIDHTNIPDGLGLDPCYKKAFSVVTVYFKENFDIELDTNCSDFSRICYVCWDANLYLNNAAKPFVVDCSEVTEEEKKKTNPRKINTSTKTKAKVDAFKPVNVAGKNNQHDRNVISAILKFLKKRNLSITHSYDDWLRVGFAIANTFNYDLGVKYFLALSQLDKDKYDESKCIEKLQECYMSGKGEVTLGSIIEMARNRGFKGSSEDL